MAKTDKAPEKTAAQRMKEIKEEARSLQALARKEVQPALEAYALIERAEQVLAKRIADLQGNERAMGRTQAAKDLAARITDNALYEMAENLIATAMEWLAPQPASKSRK